MNQHIEFVDLLCIGVSENCNLENAVTLTNGPKVRNSKTVRMGTIAVLCSCSLLDRCLEPTIQSKSGRASWKPLKEGRK
jgi:hypothetical protein